MFRFAVTDGDDLGPMLVSTYDVTWSRGVECARNAKQIDDL